MSSKDHLVDLYPVFLEASRRVRPYEEVYVAYIKKDFAASVEFDHLEQKLVNLSSNLWNQISQEVFIVYTCT